MDKHANNPICPTCGYDLAGIIRENDTATCPECSVLSDAKMRNRRRPITAVLMMLGLILAPALIIPILAIATIQILPWERARSFAEVFVPIALIVPVLWIPGVLVGIWRMYSGRTQRGDVATIIVTASVVIPFAVIAYYLLVIMAALMMSGL